MLECPTSPFINVSCPQLPACLSLGLLETARLTVSVKQRENEPLLSFLLRAFVDEELKPPATFVWHVFESVLVSCLTAVKQPKLRVLRMPAGAETVDSYHKAAGQRRVLDFI